MGYHNLGFILAALADGSSGYDNIVVNRITAEISERTNSARNRPRGARNEHTSQTNLVSPIFLGRENKVIK